MTTNSKALTFAQSHRRGTPLVLYNAWDAGSARTIASAGAQAVASSSWAVAAAHGYKDGEVIPFDFVEQIVTRIASSVDVPVTIDIEGGYSGDDSGLASNIARLIDTGIVGVNFEDRIIARNSLRTIDDQARRIAIVRKVAEEKGIHLFINARTDVFFLPGQDFEAVFPEALQRAEAYAAAGASGMFHPGLIQSDLGLGPIKGIHIGPAA